MARLPGVRASVIKCQVENLRELKMRFSDIGKTVNGERVSAFQTISRGIQEGYRLAAGVVLDQARKNAASGNTPSRLYSGSKPAIFSFTDFNSSTDNRRARSAMVGVRTGAPPRKDSRLYVEWGSRSGHKKGMSLGRIFESGTRRGIKPRRYFRNAWFSTRSKVLSILTSAYTEAIRRFN